MNNFVETIATFAKVQQPKLEELTRESARRILEDYEARESYAARSARDGIPWFRLER